MCYLNIKVWKDNHMCTYFDIKHKMNQSSNWVPSYYKILLFAYLNEVASSLGVLNATKWKGQANRSLIKAAINWIRVKVVKACPSILHSSFNRSQLKQADTWRTLLSSKRIESSSRILIEWQARQLFWQIVWAV